MGVIDFVLYAGFNGRGLAVRMSADGRAAACVDGVFDCGTCVAGFAYAAIVEEMGETGEDGAQGLALLR